jgi:hypothetical protein
MTRRDKNFKLSKESKRLLACYVDPHKRGLFKNSMIEAEIAASVPFKAEKKPNNRPKNEA